MFRDNNEIGLINLLAKLGRIWPGVVLLIVTSNGFAQTITKTASPTVQVPSTEGKITKWAGDKNGAGILGDSVITESGGNIVVAGDATANTLNATTLNVSGNATVGGTLTATVSSSSVNTTDLTVTNNATVGGTVSAGSLSVTGGATVGGTLSADIVNANTQYNIGGSRVLTSPGSNNIFAGVGAGQNNTTGDRNSFFGVEAGRDNTTGNLNAFLGFQAGDGNSGNRNSFFGVQAGRNNTANENAFFGSFAGRSNTTGNANSFFGGTDTGINNTTGSGNSFFGYETGQGNTTGGDNSFYGIQAGSGNTTGSENTFVGVNAGWSNIGGSDNTVLGAHADVSANLTHATAIGAGSLVLFSNQIVLGRNGGQDSVFVPGNLTVGGTLFKGSSTFKIDHPLDPANKTLSHSVVESPDMMNIYNGNITTDAKGEANVTLPEYFDALNRDIRYQLTVIGQFAQAIVAKEFKNNSFTIKTDKPNVKVSWQVTGIRQDAFANANRIQIVEDKGKQRGTYLHPELFNSASARAPGIDPR